MGRLMGHANMESNWVPPHHMDLVNAKGRSSPPAPPPPPPPPPPCLPGPAESPSWRKVEDASLDLNADPLDELRVSAQKLKECLHYYTQDEFKPDTIFICYYNWVPSRIQEGPSCGLVALEMASKLFNKDVSIEKILGCAREKGVTKQGEMFSAAEMAKLAEDIYDCRTMVLADGLKDKQLILNHILSGNAILVPYDKDHDFRPCCKNGYKAHWAIITGLLLPAYLPSTDVTRLKQDEKVEYLFHSSPELLREVLFCNSNTDVYICGKHGKSRRLALWKYDEMWRSNENLYQLNPKIADNLSDYVVPKDGGQLSGLRQKVVLLFTTDKN